ncbi:MAG TPA: alpha/beta hydrolase [Acidisarcina sp.]
MSSDTVAQWLAKIFLLTLLSYFIYFLTHRTWDYRADTSHGINSCVLAPSPPRTDTALQFLWHQDGSDRQTMHPSVYFVTERESLHGINPGFGSHRNLAHKPAFGVAEVELPPTSDPRIVDTSKSPPIKISLDDREKWLQEVARRSRFSLRGDSRLTIYIHGFNNGYREEIWRATKLSMEADLGTLVVFDWPSANEALGYQSDRKSIEYSSILLANLISDLASNLGATRLNIITHSMGGYGITGALSILADEGRLPQIENLILAAPDVDTPFFDRHVGKVVAQGKVRFLTVYASEADSALELSHRHNNDYAPLGLLPNFSQIKGVRTVDATRVAKGVIGHDYFVSSPEVEHDISNVIGKHGPFESALPTLGKGPVVYPRLECSF